MMKKWTWTPKVTNHTAKTTSPPLSHFPPNKKKKANYQRCKYHYPTLTDTKWLSSGRASKKIHALFPDLANLKRMTTLPSITKKSQATYLLLQATATLSPWPVPQSLHLCLFKDLVKTNGLSNVQWSINPWKSKGCFLSKYELQSYCPLPQRSSMKMLTIAYAQYSLYSASLLSTSPRAQFASHYNQLHHTHWLVLEFFQGP